MQLPTIQPRTSRRVDVGGVGIGGGSPVVIQSMTNTPTADLDATVEQVERLAAAGAELVRVAAATPEDTAVLSDLVRRSPVPIVADVHFHADRALQAIDAGCAKIRLNPGNIDDPDRVRQIIAAASDAGCAIRVGVNEGSVVERRGAELDSQQLARPLVDLMVEKLAEYLTLFEEAGFGKLVLSAKSHDAVTTIAVNRELAKRYEHPLHLGVTHAGTARTGAIRSAAAIGALLAEGIGETIRISFAGDPLNEVTAAKELLASLRLRERTGVELIACPTCGRLQMDLTPVVEAVEQALAEIHQVARPITVAIMGCVVNGPGEAANADVAICAGKGKAVLYRHGERVRNVAHCEIVAAVLDEVRAVAGGA
jgi:(E)-4-hydroxy-3-methylbut-2-enyl-diphosphate synthase